MVVEPHDEAQGDDASVGAASDAAAKGSAPMVELTHNWDQTGYAGGRNFGHLAYRVNNIYETCQRLMDGGVTIKIDGPTHTPQPMPSGAAPTRISSGLIAMTALPELANPLARARNRQHAWRLMDPPDEFYAMRVFNYSIVYLMALFGFLLVDHWLMPYLQAAPVMQFQPAG